MTEKHTIQKAYQQALKEQKQPICPYCDQPLEVIQYQSTIVRWSWNEQAHCAKIGETNLLRNLG